MKRLSIIGLTALLLVPLTGIGNYPLHLLILCLLWAYVYTSWAVMGRLGMTSFGHGAFMSIGAYVVVMGWNHFGLSPWLSIPIAMVLTALTAVLIGYPCFRLKIVGHYFALVTLALSEIARMIIVALRDQITAIVQNAEFNGTNLVNGSVPGINALASADGTKRITVDAVTLSLSGSVVTITSTASISTQANASAMISIVNTSIQNVNAALAKLASGEKKFTIQNDFVSKLVDALNTGIGNLVDADMAVESARLQSLQVKQQLGVQALSIANAQPQIILSLFRGG